MAAPLLIRSSTCLRKISGLQVPAYRITRAISSDDSEFSDKSKKKAKPHPETPVKGMYDDPPPKGNVADRKPFPITLVPGKKYAWCSCGYSKHQPFCDGSHKREYQKLNKETATMFVPMKFTVEEEKQYWLCMCKQSDKRPFCDGTHQREDIQKKRV